VDLYTNEFQFSQVLGDERQIVQLKPGLIRTMSKHTEAENMNFAHHNMPEPEVYVGKIIMAVEVSIERERAFLEG
jgi:hypothetical protein